MKHGRQDYNDRIQDAAGIIPADEPVFLLRAQDKTAPETIRYYARQQKWAGNLAMADAAQEVADAMYEWQRTHEPKDADTPQTAEAVSPPAGRADTSESGTKTEGA